MKVLRVIFRFLVGLIVTAYACFLLVTSLPVVQRWVAGQAQEILSDVLDTQVTIGCIDISPLGYAQIDSLLVEDQLGYPMFFASRVSAKVSLLELLQRTVDLEHAHVYGLKAALRQERPDSAWNFQFVIDALKSENSNSTNPWLVKINSLMLRRGQVTVDRVFQPYSSDCFDPSHMVLRHVTFNAVIDKIKGDSIEVSVNRMSLAEQSGLRLTDFDTRIVKHGEDVLVPQCVFRMPHSIVDVTASWLAGQWNLRANNIYLDADDFAPVDERLKNKGAMSVKLLAHGDTAQCRIDSLELRHDVLQLVTDANVNFSPLHVAMPRMTANLNVSALGELMDKHNRMPLWCGDSYGIGFDGRVVYDERLSVIDGTLQSPHGEMKVRADVANHDKFSLDVSTSTFNLSRFYHPIGVMAMEMNASGSIKKRCGETTVNIPYIMAGGYGYDNVQVGAALLYDSLRLDVTIADKNLKGKMTARADVASRAISVDAEVTQIRPDALDGKWNFAVTSYQGKMLADVVIPADPLQTTGRLELRDFCRDGVMLADSLVITSRHDSIRNIVLQSSFMSASLKATDLRSLIQQRADSVLEARVRLWDDALLDSLFGVRLSLLDTLRVDVTGENGPIQARLLFDSSKEDEELHMDATAGYFRDSVWLDLSLLSPNNMQGNGRVEAHTALRDSSGIGLVEAKVHNLNVGYILNLVNFHSVEFDGWASGDVEMKQQNGSPYISAVMDVRQFTMNDAYMGNIDLLLSFDTANGRLGIDGLIVDAPQAHMTHAYGYVIPGKRPGSGMDLLIDTKRINAAFVNAFTKDIFEDIEGRVSGHARVYGEFSKIDLYGDLAIDTVSLKVPMLGTCFQAQGDSVLLRPGVFSFPSVHISDGRGGTAVVAGELRHNHFDDIQYDFNIEANNLLGYSFNTFGDMPFYATAYATGNVCINGKPGQLNVNIKCTPQHGTVMVYDTSTPTAVANADFISYGQLVTQDEGSTYVRQIGTDVDTPSATDINLHFDLDITPQSQMRVITDAVAGDAIVLYGRGHITADYYNKGSFYMYGTYELDQNGEYNLSIQNFMHKKFVFRPGGTITFSGAPLQGDLNLQAVYSLPSVSLNDLSSRATFNSSNVRVDCIMNLGGKCEQPRITFDFDLPNVNENEKQMVRSLISTDEERNMQVLYLLGIGRFYSYDYQGDGPGQGNVAMKSLLSSTLSSTINNVIGNALGTSNWSFGTSIATGNIGWSDMDIEGLVSGRLFNNRLLLNGQFGYRDRTTTGSNFIGDFDLQWTLIPSGNIALKAYSETNDRYFTKSSLTTQGVGLVLKKDFNRLSEMFKCNQNKKTKQQNKAKIQE